MKNNGLPNKNEWDKIVDDAFSSTEKHDFSVMYELKKAEIQKGITMKQSTNFIQRRYAGMVAAAAAIVIAVPATVYAFTNGKPVTDTQQTEITTAPVETTIAQESTTLADTADESTNKFQVEKENTYLYSLKYTPSEEAAADVQKYKVEYTWLPDNFKTYDDGPANSYYTENNGLFIFNYYRVSIKEPIDTKIDSITNYDIVEEDDKEIYIFHRTDAMNDPSVKDQSFGREVWIHFTKTNFVANLTMTDNISDDDLIKIIKGMKLVTSDSEETETWTVNDTEQDNIPETTEAATSAASSHEVFSVSDLNIAHIGDNINFDIHCDAGTVPLTLTINKAWVQDNFDGINNDALGRPADFSQYLSDDGKIYDTIKWIKYGNGVDTVDEVVKTEDVQMKVVVLEMTYKNNGDIDLTDSRDDSFALIVCPETQHFPNNVVDWFKNSDPDSPSAYPAMPINNNSTFSLEADNTTSKYSIEIPAGQSTHLKLAMLVRADQLDDTYFGMLGYECRDYRDYMANDYYFPVESIK